IRLTSELGKGTSFQILLPCAQTTGEATFHSMSTIEELAGPTRHAAILVVEDENVLRHAIAKTLRMNGFDVFEAADGSSVFVFLRSKQGKIDAFLVAMTIPGASSLDVLAEASNVRPDIRVVLTSAYAQETFSSAPSVLKVSGFIRKPFQLVDLLKTLRQSVVS